MRKGLTTKERLICKAFRAGRACCSNKADVRILDIAAKEISFELRQMDPKHNREVFLRECFDPFPEHDAPTINSG